MADSSHRALASVAGFRACSASKPERTSMTAHGHAFVVLNATAVNVESKASSGEPGPLKPAPCSSSQRADQPQAAEVISASHLAKALS